MIKLLLPRSSLYCEKSGWCGHNGMGGKRLELSDIENLNNTIKGIIIISKANTNDTSHRKFIPLTDRILCVNKYFIADPFIRP